MTSTISSDTAENTTFILHRLLLHVVHFHWRNYKTTSLSAFNVRALDKTYQSVLTWIMGWWFSVSSLNIFAHCVIISCFMSLVPFRTRITMLLWKSVNIRIRLIKKKKRSDFSNLISLLVQINVFMFTFIYSCLRCNRCKQEKGHIWAQRLLSCEAIGRSLFSAMRQPRLCSIRTSFKSIEWVWADGSRCYQSNNLLQLQPQTVRPVSMTLHVPLPHSHRSTRHTCER